jgi:predicted amidohydrolase YtcJ
VVDAGEQRLTPLAALRAYTSGGAYASHEEMLKGTLEPGRAADLQVYEGAPITSGAKAWAGLRPRLVLLAGQPVYRRP